MSNSKDLIIDLCKRVVDGEVITGSGRECMGIDCGMDGCPFSGGNCRPNKKSEQLMIAKKYLKDNNIVLEEEDNMKKTGQQVLETIKHDETWESQYRIIKRIGDNIYIERKDGIESMSVLIDLTNIYTLQRKQHPFNEVHNAFKGGKEIENCITGKKLRINGCIVEYKLPHMETYKPMHYDCSMFSAEEILDDMWYINN